VGSVVWRLGITLALQLSSTMRVTPVLLGIALAAGVVNVTVAQKVTLFDIRANFAQYRTFTWIKEPNTNDPAIRTRIVEAVDSALTRSGLQRVSIDGDLGVAAHVATEQQRTLYAFYDGVDGGWRWLGGFESAEPDPNTYDVGTLVVDIFDGRTRNAIWRGTSPKALSVESGKTANKLSGALSKMFKNFPPPPLTGDTASVIK